MSNYFQNFPTIQNDLLSNGTKQQVTNIFKRFIVRQDVKDNADVYYTYDIQAGDRPDTIAEKYYGDSSYAWVVLHFNDIEDPIFDWPLFNVDFDNYIKGKYGSFAAAQAEVHEYRKVLTDQQTKVDGTVISKRMVVVDQTTYNSLSESARESISKWDWELEQNENKKTIKILDKKYLYQATNEFEIILRNGV